MAICRAGFMGGFFFDTADGFLCDDRLHLPNRIVIVAGQMSVFQLKHE